MLSLRGELQTFHSSVSKLARRNGAPDNSLMSTFKLELLNKTIHQKYALALKYFKSQQAQLNPWFNNRSTVPGSCAFRSGWLDWPCHYHPAKTKQKSAKRVLTQFLPTHLEHLLTDVFPISITSSWINHFLCTPHPDVLVRSFLHNSVWLHWASALWRLLCPMCGWDCLLCIGKELCWGHIASWYWTVVFFTGHPPLLQELHPKISLVPKDKCANSLSPLYRAGRGS